MNGMEIVLPNILKQYKNMELPDPDDLSFYINRENRIFYVDSVISKDFETGYSDIGQIIKEVIRINIDDARDNIPVNERKPIIIMIDSPGGDLDLSFALADVLVSSKTKVITIGLSCVMSGAFIVFLAGHEKLLYPHSQVLCHQGRIENMSGTPDEISAATKNYKDTIAKMRDYILERTKIDSKTFQRYAKKDWYISPTQAVEEYGVADKIITDLSDIIK